MKKHFETIQDYWDYCELLPTNIVPENRESLGEGYNFTRTHSYKEAMELAKYGWTEGTNNIKDYQIKVFKKLGTNARSLSPIYDVVGEFPDIGQYLNGEPEHLIRFEEGENKHKKLIKILVNTCCSGGVDTDTILNRGIVITSLIDILENINYRVELTVGYVGWGYDDTKIISNTIITKNFEEVLNLERLSFILMHPSFFRRLGFRAIELDIDMKKAVDNGMYGRPIEFSTDEISNYDLYFSAISLDDNYTSNNTEKIILDYLKQLGITLEEQNV